MDTIATALLDTQGAVVGWSAEAAELVGWTAEEVYGKLVRDLLVGPSEQRWEADTNDLGSLASGQALLRHRSGRSIEVAFRVQQLGGCSAPTCARALGRHRRNLRIRRLRPGDPPLHFGQCRSPAALRPTA